MQHLNIPLGNKSKTTRRSRWVVWLLGTLITSIILISSWISTLWFTRDTIYEAAPENTIMAVRLFVSGQKGAFAESVLRHVPLISNRAIIFSDLSPYISGELVLFIQSNGSRAVAIRTGHNPLPQTRLDAQSIHVQPVGRGVVLLSETSEKLKPIKQKPKFIPGISFPGHNWIGELVDNTAETRSFLFASDEGIDITLPGIHPHASAFKKIPKGTIAYLSTPILPNASNDYLEPFLPLIQSIIDPAFLESLSSISQNESRLILTQDQQKLDFLLVTKQRNEKNAPDIDRALRSIAALNAPKIQETLLDDGSSIKEMIANPDAVSVEQVTLFGTQVNRIQTNNTTLIASTSDKQEMILTNNEGLFRSYKTQKDASQLICSGNLAAISLQPLVEMQNHYINTPNNNALLLFAQNFSSIGVHSGLFTTKIRLCR